MTESSKKKISFVLIAMTFVQLASSATSPALASIKADPAFANNSASLIAMLSTLPSLLGVPATLLCGSLVGRKIKYRTMAILGLNIVFITGIAPYFTKNFYLLLAWRALFGVGAGFVTPLVMPIMMASFEGAALDHQASLNAISTNTGAVFFQMLGGVLCAQIGWRYTFLIYIFILPSLILVIKDLSEPQISPKNPAEQQKLSIHTYLPIIKWCVLYGLHMVFFYVSVTETSSIVMQSGFGDSTAAAVILSLVTGAGVAGGWLYKRISKFKAAAISGAFVLLAVGYLIMAISPNIWLLAIGAIIVGIGFGINMPAFTVFTGLEVPSTARSVAASILALFGSLGGFFSKFIVEGIVTGFGYASGRPSYIVCVICYLVLAVATLIIHIFQKKSRKA